MSREEDDHWESWVGRALPGRHLRSAPPAALRRARSLAADLHPGPRGVLPWLARLVFDSAGQPLPAGVRSGGSAERRLLYQANPGAGAAEGAPCQLDLRMRREPSGTVVLTGQLLPPWPDAELTVSCQGTTRAACVGMTGEFLVRDLPPGGGSFELRIRGAGQDELLLEDIPFPGAEATER